MVLVDIEYRLISGENILMNEIRAAIDEAMEKTL